MTQLGGISQLLAIPWPEFCHAGAPELFATSFFRGLTVLSISFKVDVPTGKVGGSLLFERQRRKLPRGIWGHAPPENFEI